MPGSPKDRFELDLVHVNVASIAGAYTVGNASFFRYILRLGELGLPLSIADQEAVDVLAAVPHALGSDDDVSFVSGRGWREIWTGRYWKRRPNACTALWSEPAACCGRTPHAST
jgi:hypothetical protein